jgi:crotonobetainyl-CoA:carnitine CoA-transferase CaiB-like acyl-CoA transferase
MTLQPLAGLRVLDFTAFPPGAFCTVMLADLGAEIIRVEPPAQKGAPSVLYGQVAISRAKRSMTLDMRNPQSSAVLARLIATVDVVIENAKPGAMEARGFGYRQAREANSRVIWCAITGFGQTGPYADHAGHDLSYLAHSGLLDAISDDPGFQPGIQLAVPLGAMAAVIGIQSALLRRAGSGEGAFVDVSLSEAAGWLLTGGMNPLSDQPIRLRPTHDRRLYLCADGRHVAVACAEPRTWTALCDGLGLPELKDNLRRPEASTATIEALAAAFKARPAMEWVERLAPLGAAVTRVNHGQEVLEDPQVRARNAVVEVAGTPVPASPIQVSTEAGGRTATAAAPPPMVGQHTEAVLSSAGFSPAEIEALAASGLI